MDIQNTQNLNLNTNTIKQNTTSAATGNSNFAEELKNIEQGQFDNEVEQKPSEEEIKENKNTNNSQEKKNENNTIVKESKKDETHNADSMDNAIDGLKDVVSELNKLSQKDDVNKDSKFKNSIINENEDTELIDNNTNIQEPQEKKLETQMGTNMSFNSNGQQFADFINQDTADKNIQASEKELAEEKSILSTMEENIAIARKNMLIKEKLPEKDKNTENINENKFEPKTVIIHNEEGIKKVDKKTNLTVDTIVKYDNVIMDKSDVDFFVNLVENGFVNMNEVKNTEKSAQVSKTLADLLAKSMNENKPVRIDFDNNISVIIKIDRAGKISADFLPSSQVAEAYLKENLPILKQRFDDNNIDYNELNQRKQKQDTQDNRKKGRKNE